jgi:hypothetical protein
MVENRSNIAWYLPVGYTAKLLPIFQQIAAMRADNGIQASQGQAAQDRPAPQERASESRDG